MAKFGSTAISQAFQDWRREKKSPTILVVGNTGTGKSALINGMTGEKVAAEAVDTFEKGTTSVGAYTHPDSDIMFLDTPGLQDGSGMDIEYITGMKNEGCADANVVLYCVNMNARFQHEDHETIMNLTEGLGKGIWSKTIVALTFANEVVDGINHQHKRRPGKKSVRDTFTDLLKSWKDLLIDAVESAGVDNEIAKCIPIVPAGYNMGKLFPDDDNDWVESLWHVHAVRRNEMEQSPAQPTVHASNQSGISTNMHITTVVLLKFGTTNY